MKPILLCCAQCKMSANDSIKSLTLIRDT
ncbi:unnamed protein product, partial [Adineta steineri]